MPINTLTGKLLWNALRDDSRTIRTRAQVGYSPEVSISRVQAAMMNMWAATTFHDRRLLIERWFRWCVHYKQEPTAQSAVMFVMSIRNLKVQGQLAYAKAMSGTFKQLGWERQDLLSLATALRAQGGAIPYSQAKPLLKADLIWWLDRMTDPMLRLTTMVCWKTASRWGEMTLLTTENFIVVTPEEVIVSWSTLPKGRKADPYTPSMYTVIRGPWTAEIARHLKSIKHQRPFCPWSTEQLDYELSRIDRLKEYSGHSFKRGAATHVVNEVYTKQIEFRPTELSILLKHKITYDLLSSSDLRYPEAGPNLARILGTQNLTRLL
jgi:hypothetical protein